MDPFVTFVCSGLQFLDVCLGIEMSCSQGTIQPTVGDTDLIINHSERRYGNPLLVSEQIIGKILHVSIGDGVHHDCTLQWRHYFSLCYNFLHVLSLGETHRGLDGDFAERRIHGWILSWSLITPIFQYLNIFLFISPESESLIAS